MTLRTKFIGGFAALLVMIAALTFTSLRAMSSLNAGLDRVAHRMSMRADRTSQLVESLIDIAGRQQALLLHSILSDTAGVERNRQAVSETEHRIDGLFGELLPLIDSTADKRLATDLQTKMLAVRPMSEEVAQLIQKQQMNDALKLVSEKLLPAYDDLTRNARDFVANQRDRMSSDTAEIQASASATRAMAFVFVVLTVVCSCW